MTSSALILLRCRGLLLLAFGLLLASCSSSKEAQQSQAKPATKAPADPALATSENLAQKPSVTRLFADAATFQAQEDYERAAEKYQQVLDRIPNHAATHFNLAKVARQQGQFRDALSHAKTALQQEPGNYWYHRNLAEVYEQIKEHNKAAKVLQTALDSFPQRNMLRLHLADVYMKQGKYDRVLAMYDDFEQRAGYNETIAKKRTQVYLRKDQPEKAAEELKKLIEHFPNNTNYAHDLYRLYDNYGPGKKAEGVLKNLLAKDSTDAFALFNLVDLYIKDGQVEEASRLLKSAFNNSKVSLDAKVRYVTELLFKSETAEQQEKFGDLVDILEEDYPNAPEVLSLKGNQMLQANQMDSARHYYRRALKEAPKNKALWTQLIQLDLNAGSDQELIQDTERALEFYPNDAQLNYFNGFAHYRAGEYEEALGPLDKYLLMNEQNMSPSELSSVHSLMGDIYKQLGKPDKARRHYEQGLEAAPNNNLVRNNFAYFLAQEGRKLDRALELMERVMKEEGSRPSYQDTYGWIFYKRGEYDKALEWVEKAYEADGSPEVTDHLGDIYYQLGQKDRARQYWKEAREKGVDAETIKRKLQHGLVE